MAVSAVAGDLDIAKAALRDGLWSVARTHAEKAKAGDESLLIVLESYAEEGRWDAVAKVLEGCPGSKGDAFDYYRAAAKGDLKGALAILKRTNSASGQAEAKMLEADLLAKSGDLAGANRLWREVATDTNASERAFAAASVNLGDVILLQQAYGRVKSVNRSRLIGLKLGMTLLKEGDSEKVERGEKLVKTIVRDAPDTDGAMDALLLIADLQCEKGLWEQAVQTCHEAVETWPDATKSFRLHEGWGTALLRLGRREESLVEFRRASELAKDDDERALAALKEGDALSELGRGEEAMSKYREILSKYPKTAEAEVLKRVVRVRELETKGRDCYRECRYDEAMKAFAEVAAADTVRAPRMGYYKALCLYGQGHDDQAAEQMKNLAANCSDKAVRADAKLWLAKLAFNRSQWKESSRLFGEYAHEAPDSAFAPEALVWSARASYSGNDFNQAIQTVTRMIAAYPDSSARSAAFLVQGESLIELARFDEAIMVLENAALVTDAPAEERIRAKVLKADSLFAMGADNPVRYATALEEYRAVRFGGSLTPSVQLTVSFKIARTLEKLKRIDEAIGQYYAQVVLAYRDGREQGVYFEEDARAAFSRAAFWLVDEYESRGRDFQALNILELVAASDVPAAVEARKRIEKIERKGRFL